MKFRDNKVLIVSRDLIGFDYAVFITTRYCLIETRLDRLGSLRQIHGIVDIIYCIREVFYAILSKRTGFL